MVAMLGLMSTEATPASLRALRACDPGRVGCGQPLRFSTCPRVTHCSPPGGVVWRVSGRVTRHTGVVELSSLANGKTTTANDKNLLDVDVLAGLYRSAREVCLRIGSGLRSAGARQGGGGGEEPFLAQPGDGRLGLCAKEAMLRASSQRPELGGRYCDAATMTEDGRSAARLGHGRQHYSGRSGFGSGRRLLFGQKLVSRSRAALQSLVLVN